MTRSKCSNRWTVALLGSVAVVAMALIIGFPTVAQAQTHTGGGHDKGTHDTVDHEMDGKKGAQKRKGQDAGREGGHSSLRDVFREMEDEAVLDSEISHGKGKKPKSERSLSESEKGKKAGKKTDKAESDEDSDRPEWAGTPGKDGKPGRPNQTAGTKKGTIYGDMYIIVRDENGVPILDANGFVQVYYIDPVTNEVKCCIPRDAEGNLLPTLPDGVTAVLPIEVELGRLSVGRSPSRVLSAQYEEAINSINDAVSVSLDAAGRIVLLMADGTTKTIDSPLANLALYVELMNTGTLAGVDPSKLGSLAFLVDGVLTAEDLKVAASFFAAASDKTVAVSIDSIVYMNSILNVDGTLPDGYVDYSSFTYDRASVYSSMTVEVLVQQPDGTWIPTVVNVYDAVFGSTPLTADNVAGFTAATDDARLVINFIHEYSVPLT